MKTSLLLAAALVAATSSLNAQDTVKQLYSGDPVDVTWANTLTIPADDFTEGVKAGDYISISLSNATDVLEIKANGTWLPGSIFTNISGKNEYKAYITPDMLAALRSAGLEICGAQFTVNSVSVMNDGFVMPEGAIWGGYFWVENWNTLELFKTAFDNYSGQRYLNIYRTVDQAAPDFDGYLVKVLTAWDNPDAVWADNADIKHSPSCATVDLNGIDVKEALASVDKLMIQSNPEGGAPYNLTAITLTDAPVASRIETVTSLDAADILPAILYNLQGVAVASDVTPADLSGLSLPAGVYILNGRKHLVK